jgi:prepilin-type N-terminal cleavage/methylation domain-containing protein
MTRDGFTLIEVVFSLTLIGVLAVATTSWTTSALKLERARSIEGQIRHELEILDRSIRLDLAQSEDPVESSTPRVSVGESTLSIQTRDHGSRRISYGFIGPVSTMQRDGVDEDSDAIFPSLGPGVFQLKSNPETRVARITIRFTNPDAPHRLVYHVPMRWIE